MQSRAGRWGRGVALAAVLWCAARAVAAEGSAAEQLAPSADGAAACAGLVVNLSCDSVRVGGGIARCDEGEHYFALKVDGASTLQPLLLASGPPSVERLRAGAFTGQQVRVIGSCPPSGAIQVDDVVPLG